MFVHRIIFVISFTNINYIHFFVSLSGTSRIISLYIMSYKQPDLVDSFYVYEKSAPYVLMSGIVAIGLANQNLSWLFYLIFLAVTIFFRMLIYKGVENANKIYALATENGLRSIGTFIGAFTFMYLTLPMLLNKSVNFWIMCVLVLYMVSDFFVRRVNNRSSLPVDTFVNFIAGAGTAVGAVFFMTGLKIEQHLMFNETSSNKVMCSVPKKQTFKCAVYKNGELIGSA